jgi:hypothetical protein
MSCLEKSQIASGKWDETDLPCPACCCSLKVSYTVPELFTEQSCPSSGCTAELPV